MTVPTPEKVPDVFLLKHVKAARAKAKAACLAAEKTLRMTCNALQTVQSRLDQAKFTAELHVLNLVVSIPRIEAFENRYDKVERTEYLGNKKPVFFQDKTECYVCEDTKKVPRPVRRAERYEDCYKSPPGKKLPHLIEDIEKPDNTKLFLVKVKEHDGSYQSTGNDANVTQLLREAMEDTRGQWQVVLAASKAVKKAEEDADNARWALKKARTVERRLFSGWQLNSK